MTIADTLINISYYPVPDAVVISACTAHDITATDEADSEVMHSQDYELAKADVLKWLVYAPMQLSENGVSFRKSDEEQRNFRLQCNEILRKYKLPLLPTVYGYKGSNF